MNGLDTQKSPLIVEFLIDHQQFSRLLYQIRKLLADRDVEKAKDLAVKLDRLAGPHIAFEEMELYPRLAQLGEQHVTEELLIGQHHEALNALRELLQFEGDDMSSIRQMEAGFADALEHAEHCGSLISLMLHLSDNDKDEALAALKRLRKEGPPWTQMD